MQNLMIFEGHNVEVFELNGQVLFNPYHVGTCLELGDSATLIRLHLCLMMQDRESAAAKRSFLSRQWD